MAEYRSWPLWDSATPGDIDPASLPLSAEVRDQLEAWAARYDATLDSGAPQRSGFPTEEAARRWLDEGRGLAKRIRRELPDSWSLSYFHEHDAAIDLVARP